MDTWKIFLEKESNKFGPYNLLNSNTVFDINKTHKAPLDQSITKFIEEYLSQYNLAHLYALNAACMRTIESSVINYMFNFSRKRHQNEETINSNFGNFEEVESIIDVNRLLKELYEINSGKYNSDYGIVLPPNVKTLGQLSYQIQKTIESDRWNKNEKAHAYMCSLTIGNYKLFDYESFTYQLSRNIANEETIDNFIPFLQEDADDATSSYKVRHTYSAEVLRLIEWAKIGNISMQIKEFCEPIDFFPPDQFSFQSTDDEEEIFDALYWYLNPPYSYFRSNLALEYLREPLTSYLLSCQSWLHNCFNRDNKTFICNSWLNAAIVTQSTCYVFGAYRLGINKFDKALIKDATAYLQACQSSNGIFSPKDSFDYSSYELNAMIIHALWISDAFGWERSARRALKAITEIQDNYGIWQDETFDNSGYLTGLLLDSFELINDSPNVTFSIPENKKKPEQPKPVIDHSEIENSINKIAIDTIINIFGDSICSKSKKKTSKKTKASPKSSTEIAKEINSKWEDFDKAYIYFYYDNKTKFKFVYRDHDPKLLPIKETSRLYKLLSILSNGRTIKAKDLEDKFNNDKAGKIVSSCNEILNRKIRETGVSDWEGIVTILGREERGMYKSFIPILKKEDYEHQYLLSQEEIIKEYPQPYK